MKEEVAMGCDREATTAEQWRAREWQALYKNGLLVLCADPHSRTNTNGHDACEGARNATSLRTPATPSLLPSHRFSSVHSHQLFSGFDVQLMRAPSQCGSSL